MAFEIVFVCTGNICRSPLAERLLRAALPPELGITTSSAGTGAVVGHPMDLPSALVLRDLGGDPAGHVARQVTRGIVARAGLVLTAATAHRTAVLALEPLAFRRTFTLREFARVGAGLPALPEFTPESLRTRVAEVAARRGTQPAPADGADDIADPYGGSAKVAELTGAQIVAALRGVVAGLGVSASR